MEKLLSEGYSARMQFASDMERPETMEASVKKWLGFAMVCCLCTGCLSWVPYFCASSSAENNLRDKVQKRMLAMTREESDALFSQLDLNNDGELDLKELKAGARTIHKETGEKTKCAHLHISRPDKTKPLHTRARAGILEGAPSPPPLAAFLTLGVCIIWLNLCRGKSAAAAKKILKEADTDSNKTVDRDEFHKYLSEKAED
eukprot:SAG22_NODE_561_length_9080_cov_2.242623_5_plen_202_part_00